MLQRLIFCCLSFIYAAQAAFEIQSVAPAVIARGGIVSLYPGASNPAALVENRGFYCGLDYSNLYGIKNLKAWDLLLLHTNRSQTGVAFQINVLGNTIYQEKTFGLSYGRQLTKVLACGLTGNYYDLTISNYRHTGAWGLNCGAQFFPDSTLSFALLFQNVNAPQICGGRETLPQVFAFGWRWLPLKRGELSGEIFKDTRRPFIYRTGIRIEFLQCLYLLGGVQFNPDRLSGGLELNLSKIRLALAIQHHTTLPYTLYCGCSISI